MSNAELEAYNARHDKLKDLWKKARALKDNESELRKFWSSNDGSGNDMLTLPEVRKVLRRMGRTLSEAELSLAFDKMDDDNSGAVIMEAWMCQSEIGCTSLSRFGIARGCPNRKQYMYMM